jgi:hypothetical protein
MGDSQVMLNQLAQYGVGCLVRYVHHGCDFAAGVAGRGFEECLHYLEGASAAENIF